MVESRGFGAAGAVLVTQPGPTDCWDLSEALSLGRIATTLGRYEGGSANN